MFLRKKLPLIIVFILGVIMATQYFIPHPISQKFYDETLDWLVIMGIFGMPLGVVSFFYTHIMKIKRRAPGWGYSLIAIGSFFMMIFFGLPILDAKPMEKGTWFTNAFEFIYIPIQATMFALLSFYIATAAYRAFRARSVVATIVLVSAVIVMIGRVPIGYIIHPYIPKFAEWIMNVPNLAAQRAIVLGLGLGAVATALKIILGIERSYMGQD